LNPLVSVIIPTFNRAELLKRAVNSVINQEYQNFEIIIIDDSTKGNSENAVKGFPERNIKYLKRKQRESVAAKRNIGITLSKGTYIAFLDDDDEWLPKKLTLQVDLLQKSNSDVGAIHSNCFVDFGTKKYLYHTQDLRDQSTRRLLEGNFIATSTFILKKTCLDVVGYHDEELPYCEDWDFYVRISKKFRLLYADEPIAVLHWKLNNAADRESNNLRRVTKGYQIFFKKHWQDYKDNKVVLSRNLWYIGVNLNILKEKNSAQWYFLKAFMVYPANFLPLISFCFYILKNSGLNKKLNITDVLGSFVKQRLYFNRVLGNKQ
jgi:glycosyltransferase involved in cell wall biosynthesis